MARRLFICGEPTQEAALTPAPEQEARLRIDELLQAAGWVVQDFKTWWIPSPAR
jgi:hypothetical protein